MSEPLCTCGHALSVHERFWDNDAPQGPKIGKFCGVHDGCQEFVPSGEWLNGEGT